MGCTLLLYNIIQLNQTCITSISQPHYNIGNTTAMSLSDFVLLGKIGEGAYSSVHKAKRLSDGNIYALKKVKLPSHRLKSATSKRRRSKTHLMRCGCWLQSAAITLSSTRKPSSTPNQPHSASSSNTQTAETLKYHLLTQKLI